MLSRGLAGRALLSGVRRAAERAAAQGKRHGSHGVWSYRTPPPPPSRRSILLAEGLGGICWWWILYHCWTEPEHIYGEWRYVWPSEWSDEELGIPPDSEGPLSRITDIKKKQVDTSSC